MNDRNAFLQGQGSPIKDDAAPPEQGWRGERAADEPAGKAQRRRHIKGVRAEVEDISGTAFVEAGGADMAPADDDEGEDRSMQPQDGGKRSHPDGVSDLDMSAASPGGQSAGAPYPHGRRKSKNDFGSRMGHGGQTEIGYHGTGHLGGRSVGEDDNRNGVAETDD
ncbi:hypothetical protein Sj15T_02550 [Sphingobium sp. TA15]|uniref:Uncharacterized protein n=1 Tax=Sphingobium indicum (strain DSM 16413 / CCM 7287 / MTCC 6362 / UT26 / NBRC 101211 / UT26S) TaxID=452662 RepID=D4YZY9_SPHIU|nr:hypothetical protein [Sphingobium indicum]BAI95921.1 hypothetical protein SJA_C1-10870 [Sphingobium indicum UT26S]BDD65234.1 hypothetical protein Sj15T_02550 [Sphingobium sp. TA15]